jgi:hypothetical protein
MKFWMVPTREEWGFLEDGQTLEIERGLMAMVIDSEGPQVKGKCFPMEDGSMAYLFDREDFILAYAYLEKNSHSLGYSPVAPVQLQKKWIREGEKAKNSRQWACGRGPESFGQHGVVRE